MIVCSCTGATDKDVKEQSERGRKAGTLCGTCRYVLLGDGTDPPRAIDDTPTQVGDDDDE